MLRKLVWKISSSQGEATLYDNLEKELLEWPGTKEKYRFSHAMGGILATGAPRSGKSSSVVKYIVKKWFRAGYGGLYFSTRVGDAETIMRWAEDCGRSGDVVVFGKDSDLSFDFLDFEMSRNDVGGKDTSTIVRNIMSIHELISNYEGMGSSKNEEPFWKNTSMTLDTNGIDLMLLAGAPLSMKGLKRLVLDAFEEQDVLRYYQLMEVLTESRDEKEKDKAWEELQNWRGESYFLDCFLAANERNDLEGEQYERMQELGDYWLRQYPKLALKTKSIIIEMLMAVCRPFEGGILKSHFTKGFSPELHPDRTIFDKKIIIIDFGVKQYGTQGVCASGIMKLLYQQAWERRNLEEEGPDANPVMLFIDEFQYYINQSQQQDALFTSTAGGSLVCNFLVTQNIDNIIMMTGNNNSDSSAKSLCGNLSTKIFCANSNHATNKWASDMIGTHFVDAQTTSIADGNVKKSFAQVMQPKVPLSHFMMLKTGRRENDHKVKTVIIQTGREWKNGENFQEITFSQKD